MSLRARPSRVAAAAVVASTLATTLAWSDPAPATDVALAEVLFDEGKKLMVAGRFAEACAKLSESQRLDPGGGTLLNLASCHESQGKTASAWAEFGEVALLAQQKGRADIARTARQRADALLPRLSRLVVDVPASSRLPGLEVQRDGVRVAEASYGVQMPLDPGSHVITASAPAKAPWSMTVQLGERSDTKTVTVPALSDAPMVVAAPPSAPASTSSSPRPAVAVTTGETERVPARRGDTFAWIAAGVSVVGLGAAVGFGIRSKLKEDEAHRACPDTSCTDGDAVDASRAGVHAANYANVAGGVGLLAAGLAVYLFVRPQGQAASAFVVPTAGPSSAGLLVGRSF